MVLARRSCGGLCDGGIFWIYGAIPDARFARTDATVHDGYACAAAAADANDTGADSARYWHGQRNASIAHTVTSPARAADLL